jgi:protein CpxP
MKLAVFRVPAVALAACLTLPAISFAEQPAPTPQVNPMMQGGNMHPGGGMMGNPGMNHQAEHERLHEMLKLTPDQEGAWQTFNTAMQPPRDMAQQEQVDWSKLTTPQRADKMLAMVKARAQQMEANVSALKTFYAKLTPEQQKTFDDFHAQRMMNHPMGGAMGGPMRPEAPPAK